LTRAGACRNQADPQVLDAQRVAPSLRRNLVVRFLRSHVIAMSERDAFGPNLRRIRVQRGFSLEQLAASTKVSIALWKGLERNDFSRWPTGIYARSYVRDYAAAIGVDPESTVDDFCRWFPQGDRRAEKLVRDHAEIVGHSLDWEDYAPSDADSDRRGAAPSPRASFRETQSPLAGLFGRVRRTFGKA
jgi:transcriptional regulator with XRE-family HTH domain